MSDPARLATNRIKPGVFFPSSELSNSLNAATNTGLAVTFIAIMLSRGTVIDGFPRNFDQVNRWLGGNPLKKLD